MRTLDKKLLRDLVRMWAQSLAIALVMACGVATLVMAVGTYRSLEETRAAYYDRYRFGDIFASAVRAPDTLRPTIAAIEGVAAVETRIVAHVILDVEGLREPATGVAISLPPGNDVTVNALFLREGRLPEAGRANEVAVNANFAVAQHFSAGSTFEAVMNGAKLTLTIVGVVLSPEYIYAIGPGDMMPDDRRFGVLWMPEETLASLFKLDGAFNSLSLRLLPNASPAAVLDRLDVLLKPYGGVGARERKDQLSNAFLDGELKQLSGMAEIIPPIFLLVSAFLINMTLTRLITLEREQIGLLKALGYSRVAVAWHYVKFVLVIAAVGIALGSGVGTWIGHEMTVLYARFYAFPFLLFRTDASTYLIAAGISVSAAILGAIQAIRAAFSLPAAVAMQPPAPVVYRRIFGGALRLVSIFSQPTTMALRHIARHPVRSGLTALGISFAVALMSMALGTLDSVNFMIDTIFVKTNRQDATIMFAAPRPPEALTAVRALPGVFAAEPYLGAAAELTHDQYRRQIGITGVPERTDLSRVVDLNFEPIRLPESGLALGDRVADILHVRLGDNVRIDFLDGKRRTVNVPVTQIIQSYIGLMAYMDIDALARATDSGPRFSGAYVTVDRNRLDDLYATIKNTPGIGAIALNNLTLQRFRETMQQNMSISLIVYLTLSGIVAFGVVYNSARIQLSESARELAILRVLGFGRAEVSNVLLIEIGAVVVAAQPIGWLLGVVMGEVITRSIASDLFRVPLVVNSSAFAISTLVVGAAAAVSAFIVRRRVDRLDLVRVLKTRE
jgi:putative ABC transport system permease protein